MNLETSCVNVRTLDESVKYSAIPDNQNEEYIEAKVLFDGDSGAASTKIGTMDESVAAADVPNQHNE